MGFKPKKKIYLLKFDDPELAGLQIRATGTSIGKVLTLSMDDMRTADQVKEAFGAFADALVDWNILTDDDQPLPLTFDSLMLLPNDLMVAMLQAWIIAISDVPSPLEKKSSDTSPSLVESIPMEPLT